MITIKRSATVRLPGHDILLSFQDDEDCYMFEEWLAAEGFNAFNKWKEEEVESDRF